MIGVGGVTRQELTAASVNGRPVAVHQSHRRWTAADYVPGAPPSPGYEAVLVTVSAPVSLSLEDVAAVLFAWGGPAELLTGDWVRELVADTVVNQGSGGLEELRCALGAATLDAERAAYLACCRDRARAVFGTGCVPSPGPGALVGVS